jgi:hypothetical protein
MKLFLKSKWIIGVAVAYILLGLILVIGCHGCGLIRERHLVKKADKLHTIERKKAAKGKQDVLKDMCNGWYPFTPTGRIVVRRDTTYQLIPGKDSIAYVIVNCDTVVLPGKDHIVRVPYHLKGDTLYRDVAIHDSILVIDSIALLDAMNVTKHRDIEIQGLKYERKMLFVAVLFGLVLGFVIGIFLKRRA